jgi:DNA-directed RNA polymerase subunit M/transcription elongation factor TFIIS
MRKVDCTKCGHTWVYKGKLLSASCPSCMSKVKLPEIEIPVVNEMKRVDMCGILAKDSRGLGDLIKCPECGFDHSHIIENEIRVSKEDITIPFEGECGHVWNVCIGYDKGRNFASVETAGKKSLFDF